MRNDAWRPLARSQAGVLSRAQLAALGVARSTVRRRIASGDWTPLGPMVVVTGAGPLIRDQLLWAGILAGGPGCAIGEITAAELHGLRRWDRPEVIVTLPHDRAAPSPTPGVSFRRTRRDLYSQIIRRRGLPVVRVEPAVLTWAVRQRSGRTTEGVVAASVQQGLTSAASLLDWVDRLSPLPQSVRLRAALTEIMGGAQSVGELDVRRMCKRFGLAPPIRQVRRYDSRGHLRFTDCEWLLADGRVLVLEVDGAFHMDVEQWEDDLARQRALTDPSRVVVHCTTRELRDEPDRVAADLRMIGVPAA